MPHYLKNPLTYLHKPIVGDGSCVALIRTLVDTLKDVPTGLWVPGEKVLDSRNLKEGTVIATFLCGKFPQDGKTGKHAAIWLRYWGKPNDDGTHDISMVLDQWSTRATIQSRQLHKKGTVGMACSGGIYDASNSLDAMYVVEVRGR